MNLDRALAILGVLVGLFGAATGVYVSQKEYSIGLLLASGWIAAALIGLTICTLAFRAITSVEKAHAVTIQKYDDLNRESTMLKAEVAEFRNISRALSAVVNGEDKPSLPPPRTRRSKSKTNQISGSVIIPVQDQN